MSAIPGNPSTDFFAQQDALAEESAERREIKEAARSGDLFRHYKGGLYRKLLEGRWENSGEDVVIYKSLETGAVWVRSRSSFYGTVFAPHSSAESPVKLRFEEVRDPEAQELGAKPLTLNLTVTYQEACDALASGERKEARRVVQRGPSDTPFLRILTLVEGRPTFTEEGRPSFLEVADLNWRCWALR